MSEPTTNLTETEGITAGPSYDDINTPVIIMVGFISAVVTVLIIALVQGMAYNWEASYLKKKDTNNIPAVKQIADQKKVLEGDGKKILSIAEAKNKVIQQFGKK